MNDIFQPIILSSGSHQAGSGRGCAMNVISWENGDKTITDYPDCSDRMLARLVQGVNDSLADSNGYLSAENSIIALDLGHATVGTSAHHLSNVDLQRVYVRCAVLAARKVFHLAKSDKLLKAIEAAEAWALDPSDDNKISARRAGASAAGAGAAAYAGAGAAAYAGAAAAAAAYAAAASGAAGASGAAAYAAAAYASAAGAAARMQFKIDLAWEIINLFKDLTGMNDISCEFTQDDLIAANQKMLVKA